MSVEELHTKPKIRSRRSCSGANNSVGSITWNCWTGALAHLGVARAKCFAGEKLTGCGCADTGQMRAAAAYKDFLTLWKDADPDIPILKQAKPDYAKLQ